MNNWSLERKVPDEIVEKAWRVLERDCVGDPAPRVSAVGDALEAVLPDIERPLREEIDTAWQKWDDEVEAHRETTARLDEAEGWLGERDKEIARLASTLVQEQEECGHQMGRAERAEALLAERSFSPDEIEALLWKINGGPGIIAKASLDRAKARLEKMRDA